MLNASKTNSYCYIIRQPYIEEIFYLLSYLLHNLININNNNNKCLYLINRK